MTKKRRHLFATVGLSALSALCFGLLAWALIEGAVVQSITGSRIRQGGIDTTSQHNPSYPNKVYTREEDPGVYWKAVGLLVFFGSLFGIVARLEYVSYRSEPYSPEKELSKPLRDPQLISRRKLQQQLDERNRQQRHAAEFDSIVRAAMNSVVRSLNSRLKMTEIGWLEITDPLDPLKRFLYVVFPKVSDLDSPEVKAANLGSSVREVLCRHGYPDELLEHVSIHGTSTELVVVSFGNDFLGHINRS